MNTSDKNPQTPKTGIQQQDSRQLDDSDEATDQPFDHPSKEKYELAIEDDSYPNSRVVEHAGQDKRRNLDSDIERPDAAEQEQN